MAVRIGFVDDNADNFHANVYLKALRDPLKKRGYVVSGVTALQKKAGQAWAKANGVTWCKTPAELNAISDVFMVLAPSTPETHLELCKWVFPFGKPTYVDKTFAPDLATAKKIFALADKHGTCIQTTSALRYTSVQKSAAEAGAVKHVVSWGPGGSFGEYAIHPVEMAISVLGAEAESLCRRGSGKHSQLLINFSGGRTAVVNVYVQTNTPYAASITTDEKTELVTVDTSALFVDTMAAILDFFDAGKPNIARAESLTIRRILDVAEQPRALKGFVKL